MNKTRWLTLALVISLGINLLIAGIVIGRIIAGPPAHMPGPIHLGMLMRHVEPETREKLAPEMRRLRDSVMPLRREMRDAQQAFTTVLMADEIDEEALASAQSRLADASATLQAQVHEQMAATMAAIPPEERRRILSEMQRRGERFRDRRDRHEKRRLEGPPRD